MYSNQQHPLHSPFNARSTAAAVAKGIDLTGKNIIVTGGYSGVGLEAVKVFTKAGAHVTVPARRIEVAQERLQGLKNVDVDELNLIDPQSIHGFAERYLARNQSLDILLNSAGIMYPPLRRDSRGLESQFAINHMGHFQLTLELIPALKRAQNPRVVMVSSRGHRDNGILWDDYRFNQNAYDPRKGYSQSKTANILFAVALDRRMKAAGIHAFAVHPGAIPATNLGNAFLFNNVPSWLRPLVIQAYVRGTNAMGSLRYGGDTHKFNFSKTPQQGAATPVFAALSPLLNGIGGVYLEDCNVTDVVANDQQYQTLRMFGVREWAVDFAEAEKLWDLSLTLLPDEIRQVVLANVATD